MASPFYKLGRARDSKEKPLPLFPQNLNERWRNSISPQHYFNVNEGKAFSVFSKNNVHISNRRNKSLAKENNKKLDSMALHQEFSIFKSKMQKNYTRIKDKYFLQKLPYLNKLKCRLFEVAIEEVNESIEEHDDIKMDFVHSNTPDPIKRSLRY